MRSIRDSNKRFNPLYSLNHRALLAEDDLASKVYALVAEHGKDGILQSFVWKELGMSSRDCSRVVIRLEGRGAIRREKILQSGRWTYMLMPLRLSVNLKSIERLSCATCPYESKCSMTGVVSPLHCPWISEWVIDGFDQERQHFLSDASRSR